MRHLIRLTGIDGNPVLIDPNQIVSVWRPPFPGVSYWLVNLKDGSPDGIRVREDSNSIVAIAAEHATNHSQGDHDGET